MGCYVQHNGHILKGRRWGEFLEVRINAADSYLQNYEREKRWAERRQQPFAIFCSSSTEPFVPQEFRYGITRSILEAMLDAPPDLLILQTHSHRVIEYRDTLVQLADVCDLRIHISIETDRQRLSGLPPHASSVERRLNACETLSRLGLNVVVTVSPLLPIDKPDEFFARISEVAKAVVVDHFIEGDGSHDGQRTLRTSLPRAMQSVCADSVTIDYRDRIVEIARRHLPGRVGVNVDGFAGRYLE